MTQDDAVQLLSPRLHALLTAMMRQWADWRPKIGYPSGSCGFVSGGSVQDFEDMEDHADCEAIRVLEAGWGDLSLAERTCIEMVVGVQPWVWTARPNVLESALLKLERRLRMIGAT